MATAGDDESDNITLGCDNCGCESSILKFHDKLKEKEFLITFLQNHNLIHKSYQCHRCGEECQLDYPSWTWRCQKLTEF